MAGERDEVGSAIFVGIFAHGGSFVALAYEEVDETLQEFNGSAIAQLQGELKLESCFCWSGITRRQDQAWTSIKSS